MLQFSSTVKSFVCAVFKSPFMLTHFPLKDAFDLIQPLNSTTDVVETYSFSTGKSQDITGFAFMAILFSISLKKVLWFLLSGSTIIAARISFFAPS